MSGGHFLREAAAQIFVPGASDHTVVPKDASSLGWGVVKSQILSSFGYISCREKRANFCSNLFGGKSDSAPDQACNKDLGNRLSQNHRW